MDKRCIVLDIGGRLFKTKITTLASINGSYFQQLFNTKWDHLLDSDGHLFLDRDGDIFPVILGYLRHGKSYPLPVVEKIRSYMKRNFIPSKTSIKSSNSISGHYSTQNFQNMLLMKETTTKPVLSIPTIAPPLPQKSTKNDETVMQQFARKLSRKHSKDKIEIGAPNEFKHVVHIGRADDGHKIIIDHSNNEQMTLKAIVQTIYDEISTLPIVYSLIDADKNENRSESIEIFFAGSTIQACHNNTSLSSQKISTSLQTGLYDNCCYEIARSDKTKKFHVKRIKNDPIVSNL
uniref:CRIB domain-containing protein n=1 Tax=Onchocerca volvulus TaxID=6282 RepID=A0A2K6VL71_ONCVO